MILQIKTTYSWTELSSFLGRFLEIRITVWWLYPLHYFVSKLKLRSKKNQIKQKVFMKWELQNNTQASQYPPLTNNTIRVVYTN